MNLLIFLSDFLASPKKPVYSCIFKLLAGKACFREYDCKYDKRNNWFRVSIFFCSILSLVGHWQQNPLSNFNRKPTRSVFRLYKWASIAKLLSASKLEKIKTSIEISISKNCYCVNKGKLEWLAFLLSSIHTQLKGTQCLNWSLQLVICKLDMSRQTLRHLRIVSELCQDEQRTS